MIFLLVFGTLVFSAADELITKGDAAYDNNDNKTALVHYTAALEQDPQNCDAAWKISRAYADIGDDKTSKEERTAHFNKANDFAQKAISLCPENDNAHLYLSVAIGRVALMAGKKTQVQLSQTIKDEAEKAIELNPENAVAHHVYARWHRKVATLSGVAKAFAKVLYGGLPPASLEQAVAHLQKSVDLDPDNVNNRLELGITYEMMNNWQSAKQSYEKAIALPATKHKDGTYQEEAKERLKKVTSKI